MENSQVNTKELYNVTTEVIAIIDEIYLELGELKKRNDMVITSCEELKEMDGKKVAINGFSTAEEISPQKGFKRCRIYGGKDLEEKVISFQNQLNLFSDVMDNIYQKIRLSCEISEDLEDDVDKIHDVLAGGAEVVAFQDYINQQMDDMTSKNQIMDAVTTNFEQNRALTNQVSQEVYTRAYEKLQGMLSNFGDKL